MSRSKKMTKDKVSKMITKDSVSMKRQKVSDLKKDDAALHQKLCGMGVEF